MPILLSPPETPTKNLASSNSYSIPIDPSSQPTPLASAKSLPTKFELVNSESNSLSHTHVSSHTIVNKELSIYIRGKQCQGKLQQHPAQTQQNQESNPTLIILEKP